MTSLGLECWRPKDVCKPRAKDKHGREFSSMTLYPYYDTSLHYEEGEAEGPCCDWCDNAEHADKSWLPLLDIPPGQYHPARCNWDRFCSGCSQCDGPDYYSSTDSP